MCISVCVRVCRKIMFLDVLRWSHVVWHVSKVAKHTYKHVSARVSACYVRHASPRCCFSCKSVPISVCPLAKPHQNAVKMKAAKGNKLCHFKGLQKQIIWQIFYGTSSHALPVTICWIHWNSFFELRAFDMKCSSELPHWVGEILFHFLVTSLLLLPFKVLNYLVDILRCFLDL